MSGFCQENTPHEQTDESDRSESQNELHGIITNDFDEDTFIANFCQRTLDVLDSYPLSGFNLDGYDGNYEELPITFDQVKEFQDLFRVYKQLLIQQAILSGDNEGNDYCCKSSGKSHGLLHDLFHVAKESVMPAFVDVGNVIGAIRDYEMEVYQIWKRNSREIAREACTLALLQSNIIFDRKLIPGETALRNLFSDPEVDLGHELYSEAFHNFILSVPVTALTQSEDNLILRGRNIFGEKSWDVVAARFFPDASIKTIARRHEALSYRIICNKNAIASNFDLEQAHAIGPGLSNNHHYLQFFVRRPDNFNPQRWTLEEDSILMMAIANIVNVKDTKWKYISQKILPHRDRFEIRKRWKVLSRRAQKCASMDFRENTVGSDKTVQSKLVHDNIKVQCNSIIAEDKFESDHTKVLGKSDTQIKSNVASEAEGIGSSTPLSSQSDDSIQHVMSVVACELNSPKFLSGISSIQSNSLKETSRENVRRDISNSFSHSNIQNVGLQKSTSTAQVCPSINPFSFLPPMQPYQSFPVPPKISNSKLQPQFPFPLPPNILGEKTPTFPFGGPKESSLNGNLFPPKFMDMYKKLADRGKSIPPLPPFPLFLMPPPPTSLAATVATNEATCRESSSVSPLKDHSAYSKIMNSQPIKSSKILTSNTKDINGSSNTQTNSRKRSTAKRKVNVTPATATSINFACDEILFSSCEREYISKLGKTTDIMDINEDPIINGPITCKSLTYTLMLIDSVVSSGNEDLFNQMMSKKSPDDDTLLVGDIELGNISLSELELCIAQSKTYYDKVWYHKFKILQSALALSTFDIPGNQQIVEGTNKQSSNQEKLTPLRGWISYQQKQYKLKRKGELSRLSNLKEELLKRINFDFTASSDAWYVADDPLKKERQGKTTKEIPNMSFSRNVASATLNSDTLNNIEDPSSTHQTIVQDDTSVVKVVDLDPSDVSYDNLHYKKETNSKPIEKLVKDDSSCSSYDNDREDFLENGLSSVCALMADTNVGIFTTDYVLYILTQLHIILPNTHEDSEEVSQEGKDQQELCAMRCSHCRNRRFTYRNINGLIRAFTRTIPSHFERCAETPDIVKDTLSVFELTHDIQKSRLPTHSNRKFCRALWERIQDLYEGNKLATERHENKIIGTDHELLDIDELYCNNSLIVDNASESYDSIDEKDCHVLADLILCTDDDSDDEDFELFNIIGKHKRSTSSSLITGKRKSRRQHAKDDAWMEMYDMLKKFRNKYGHCNIPKDDEEELYCYVKSQRDAYRDHQLLGGRTSVSGGLTEAKIHLLDKLGVFLRSDTSKRRRFNHEKGGLLSQEDAAFANLPKEVINMYGDVCWAWHDKYQGYWPIIVCDPSKNPLKVTRQMALKAINLSDENGNESDADFNSETKPLNKVLVYYFEAEDDTSYIENDEKELVKNENYDCSLNPDESFLMVLSNDLLSWEKGKTFQWDDEGHLPIIKQRFSNAIDTAELALSLSRKERLNILNETVEDLASKDQLIHPCQQDFHSDFSESDENENSQKRRKIYSKDRVCLPHSAHEDKLILELQNRYGNKWRRIASFLPGRTDNAVKNRFKVLTATSPPKTSKRKNSRSTKKSRETYDHKPTKKTDSPSSKRSKPASEQSMKCRKRSRVTTDQSIDKKQDKVVKKGDSNTKQSAHSCSLGYSKEEDDLIILLQRAHGNRWRLIASHLPGRSDNGVKNRFNHLSKKNLIHHEICQIKTNPDI